MKKQILAVSAAAALMLPQTGWAEGFAINEWTAEGVAMGGARMFADNDPGNIAYNPASITKVEGEAFKQSAVYISPHGKWEAQTNAVGAAAGFSKTESGKNVVHAGWSLGNYYVKQLNEKEWFGVGTFPRFGMLSEFERNSLAASNAFFSKLVSISVTPTYARKFDDKWSAAVGAEVNYVGLELQKNIYGQALGGNTIATQTEGDSYALGWNAAANYTFDDKNEIGLVYRSRIKHSMEADFRAYGASGGDKIMGAYGEVTLPDSWSIGYSHKFDDRTRVELNGTYTKWSTYDALNISFSDKLPIAPGLAVDSSNSDKNWSNGWRYAIGVEHKLSNKYTVMAGFAYDESSIPYDGGDFIVPTGERRTYSLGARYNDEQQALAVAFAWMDIGGLSFAGHGMDGYSSARTHDNYAKVIGVSYERRF